MGDAPQEDAGGVPFLTPTVIVSLLAAAIGVVAGMGVWAGWLYMGAYYREFGIEPSALSFSPYEYALRAPLGLAMTLGSILGAFLTVAAAGELKSIPASHALRVLGGHPSGRTGRDITILGVGTLVSTLGLALWVYLIWRTGWLYLWLASFALGASLAFVAYRLIEGKRGLLFPGVVLLILLVSVLIYVPQAQAKSDASRDRDHLDKFPAVTLVAAQELGIPHDESDGAFHKYGPYRLVLRNNGMYYLVAEEEPDDTIAVPEDSITYLQLHKGR